MFSTIFNLDICEDNILGISCVGGHSTDRGEEGVVFTTDKYMTITPFCPGILDGDGPVEVTQLSYNSAEYPWWVAYVEVNFIYKAK